VSIPVVDTKASHLKLGALIGGVAGVALAVWLLRSYGLTRVLDVVIHVGWLGMVVIVLLHLLQVLLSALGWQVIAASSGGPRLRLRTYVLLRWVREAIDNLLPLAQIGGEFAAAGLLQRRGVPLAGAIAGTIADLLLEMATQVLFTLLGVFLLVHLAGHSDVSELVIRGLLIGALVVAAAFAAMRLGVAAVVERAVLRLGESFGWPSTARIGGLHAALVGCYGSPARVALGALWHLVSWLLGCIEVCLVLHFFGRDVGIGPGLVIESLGQAAKSMGFAVPGAVGVQEGGFVVICGVLGIAPEIAIALSLVKRLRDILLGIPALVLWHRASGKEAIVRSRAH
jgi:putative membrane protein